MMINVNLVGETISGSVNGQQFGVSYDADKYQKMLELQEKSEQAISIADLQEIVNEFIPLTQESYKEIIETQSPYLFVNKSTNKFYLQFNGTVSKIPMPQVLADKILKATEKDLDVTPLVKCWVRFMRNPKFSAKKAELFAQYISAPYTNFDMVNKLMKENGVSEKVATERATTPQVAITKEGLLVGYKVSREIVDRFVLDDDTEEVKKRSMFGKTVDPITGMVTYTTPEHVEDRYFQPAVMMNNGDEFSCTGIANVGQVVSGKPGHIIRVGCLHALDSWDKVNCNDGQSCVPGLHVGGLNYIAGYQQDGTVTHNVLIDPMHIGAVVIDKDHALRVKQYFVHSSFAGVNRNIYHSSTYSAITDTEYAAMVAEVVAKTQELNNDQAANLAVTSSVL